MEDRKITVKEALEITARLLGGIKVPVDLYDDIGVPIKQAIRNIQVCIESSKEQANKESVVEEPVAEETEN